MCSGKGRFVHNLVSVTAALAQELAVEEVDEDLPYSCFREAVRAVHGDELATYALQLRQGHWRRWQLEGSLNAFDCYLSASLSCVVLLVRCYLGDDIGGGLIELVEVVLLGRRFLHMVRCGHKVQHIEVRTSTVAW